MPKRGSRLQPPFADLDAQTRALQQKTLAARFETAGAPLTMDGAETLVRQRKDASAKEIRARRERARTIAAGIEDAAARRQFLAAERAHERGIRDFWRSFRARVRRQVDAIIKRTRKAAHGGSSKGRALFPLPAYPGPIIDRHGRRCVYMDILYHSAKTAKIGVSRRCVAYILRQEAIERGIDGALLKHSNVGETDAEIKDAFDLVETLNRAARSNAKVVHTMVLNLPHDIPAEERMAIVRMFCAAVFEAYDLPYVASLHTPSPEGDQRNFHAHIVFSFRPTVRTGDHEWDVGRELRADRENKERFREMRAVFADIMTLVARRSGHERRSYTALSNVDRGLKAKPLRKLGGAETAAARRGEAVLDNEHNRAQIVINLAAMADDRAKRRRQKLNERVASLRALRAAMVDRAALETRPPVVPARDRAPISQAKPARPVSPVYAELLPAIAGPARTVRPRGIIAPPQVAPRRVTVGVPLPLSLAPEPVRGHEPLTYAETTRRVDDRATLTLSNPLQQASDYALLPVPPTANATRVKARALIPLAPPLSTVRPHAVLPPMPLEATLALPRPPISQSTASAPARRVAERPLAQHDFSDVAPGRSEAVDHLRERRAAEKARAERAAEEEAQRKHHMTFAERAREQRAALEALADQQRASREIAATEEVARQETAAPVPHDVGEHARDQHDANADQTIEASRPATHLTFAQKAAMQRAELAAQEDQNERDDGARSPQAAGMGSADDLPKGAPSDEQRRLAEMLASIERDRIYLDYEDLFYRAPAALLRQFGIPLERQGHRDVRAKLLELGKRQDGEIDEVLNYMDANLGQVRREGGRWLLTDDAPEPIRMLAEHWQRDERARREIDAWVRKMFDGSVSTAAAPDPGTDTTSLLSIPSQLVDTALPDVEAARLLNEGRRLAQRQANEAAAAAARRTRGLD